jgi:hypothetical protein
MVMALGSCVKWPLITQVAGVFSFPKAGILQVKRKAGVMYETSNPQGSCGAAHSISSPDTHTRSQKVMQWWQ